MTGTNDKRVKRRNADETCIRAFVSSSDRIYSLVEELGGRFQTKSSCTPCQDFTRLEGNAPQFDPCG